MSSTTHQCALRLCAQSGRQVQALRGFRDRVQRFTFFSSSVSPGRFRRTLVLSLSWQVEVHWRRLVGRSIRSAHEEFKSSGLAPRISACGLVRPPRRPPGIWEINSHNDQHVSKRSSFQRHVFAE